MSLRGAKKAAFLLMGLDAATASELLKAVRPEEIKEITAELVSLQADGAAAAASLNEVREFCGLLQKEQGGVEANAFVKRLLEDSVGPEQSKAIMEEVDRILQARDPFKEIVSADIEEIARALQGESAQVAAVVLSELPTKKSSAMLGLLDEAIRADVIRCMTGGEEVSANVRLKVADTIQRRLRAFREQSVGAPVARRRDRDEKVRNVAVLLRSLSKEFRDGLMEKLKDSDGEIAAQVQQYMVIWEDVPAVPDRPLQEVLRSVDAKTLAVALTEADATIVEKLRSNMSERAQAMLDEETELLSSPKADEIAQAREKVLAPLRELNAKGELDWNDSQ